MAGHVTADGYTELGIGLISVGWMGKLHSRAYQAIPHGLPGARRSGPGWSHAADTAPDRADYARDVLGYAKGSTDYREVLADPDVDVVSICAPEPAAPRDRHRGRRGREAVLDREAGRPRRRRDRRGRRRGRGPPGSPPRSATTTATPRRSSGSAR